MRTLLGGLLSLVFGCKSQGPFEKKDGVWHYRDEPIADADARTFEPLDDHYAKDRSRVYYCDTYRKGQEYYMIRHNRVTEIAGADVATFTLLEQRYARDAKRVYYEGAPFPVKDPASFVVMYDGFARDRLTGYYHQAPVPGSNGETFAALDNHYSRDASNAFYSWLEPGVPPVSKTLRLVDARPASLVVLESLYATDSARVYYKGKLVTTNAATFRVLQIGYAVSSDAVYYNGEVVPGADPATFAMLETPTDSADARDAKRTYLQGRKTGAANRD